MRSSLVDNSNKCFLLLTKAKFLCEIHDITFKSKKIMSSTLFHNFLRSLVKLQYLVIHIDSCTSINWLAALNPLKQLKVLNIFISDKYICLPTDLQSWPVGHAMVGGGQLIEVVLDIKFHSRGVYDLHSPTHILVDSVLNSVLQSSQITKMVLPSISRECMAGIHCILQQCPSLTTLELMRTRLGYDGILYICSALRNNTALQHLVILDDLKVPPPRERKWGDNQFISFSSMKTVYLPGKTTCTAFLLELNNILKENTTLKEMTIRSGLFIPLSAGGDGEYCQWTGLGPLQQFNVGAVSSGMSPSLKRSFSSSELTQHQTIFFWDQNIYCNDYYQEVNFKELFLKGRRKKKGYYLFPHSLLQTLQFCSHFLP